MPSSGFAALAAEVRRLRDHCDCYVFEQGK